MLYLILYSNDFHFLFFLSFFLYFDLNIDILSSTSPGSINSNGNSIQAGRSLSASSSSSSSNTNNNNNNNNINNNNNSNNSNNVSALNSSTNSSATGNGSTAINNVEISPTIGTYEIWSSNKSNDLSSSLMSSSPSTLSSTNSSPLSTVSNGNNQFFNSGASSLQIGQAQLGSNGYSSSNFSNLSNDAFMNSQVASGNQYWPNNVKSAYGVHNHHHVLQANLAQNNHSSYTSYASVAAAAAAAAAVAAANYPQAIISNNIMQPFNGLQQQHASHFSQSNQPIYHNGTSMSNENVKYASQFGYNAGSAAASNQTGSFNSIQLYGIEPSSSLLNHLTVTAAATNSTLPANKNAQNDQHQAANSSTSNSDNKTQIKNNILNNGNHNANGLITTSSLTLAEVDTSSNHNDSGFDSPKNMNENSSTKLSCLLTRSNTNTPSPKTRNAEDLTINLQNRKSLWNNSN
jgi:hypothetical protein